MPTLSRETKMAVQAPGNTCNQVINKLVHNTPSTKIYLFKQDIYTVNLNSKLSGN